MVNPVPIASRRAPTLGPRCAKSVEDALGRVLSAAEKRGIVAGVNRWKQLLGRQDEQKWRAMSGSQQLRAAGEAYAKEMMHEAALQKRRLALQVPVLDRVEKVLDSAGHVTAKNFSGRQAAISRLLAPDPAKRSPLSIESAANAIEKLSLGAMRKMLLAGKPKVMGLFEDAKAIHDLIKEIYGEDSGNPVAREAAESWKKWAETARQRINAAGADIGKLGEHYFPQFHDMYKVAAAGKDHWLNYIMPRLDRSKYLELDGTRMRDDRLREFLTHAYTNIVNDGKATYEDNKHQPDMLGKDMFAKKQFGYGLYADRHSAHRQIFFKDADSFMQYQSDFGGRSFFSMMQGHVRRLARDTAVLERFGPYADQMFDWLNQREARAARDAFPQNLRKINDWEGFNNDLYDAVTGRHATTPSRVDNFFLGMRNVLTGLRLGKVVITAMGDEAGMFATALANKVPYVDTLMAQARLLNPKNDLMRMELESTGLGLGTMLGSLNRWGGELYGDGWTGRFANFTMRATGAEQMWDNRRKGMGTVLGNQLGTLTRKVEHASDLNEAEHGVLARKGITENTWQVARAATPDSDGRILPSQIYNIPDEKLAHLGDATALKHQAATELMAHILEESGMGVMDTGARQRVQLSRFSRGFTTTPLGASALLFKTFATSVMLKHWNRMASLGTLGSKVGYGSALALYGTAIALAGNEVRGVLAGQQPQNLGDWHTWAGAILRGGGLGYFGDFLWDAENSNGNTLLESLNGPVETLLSDIWNVTGAAAVRAQKGERTDEVAQLIRLGRNNMPLTQLWYTSALFDHMLWANLQEAANPGYLERMEQRQNNYGRQYWWHPNQTLPSEAPNPKQAFGGQ